MIDPDRLDPKLVIQFYEAKSLIKYIRDNVNALLKESIRGIYTPGPISWSEYNPGKRIYDTAEEMIIDFDSFAIMLEYYYLSDLKIKILDHEDMNAEIMNKVHILGHDRPVTIPFQLDEIGPNNILAEINKPIKEIIIECFNHEFPIEPFGDCIRTAGGDYFASIYIITEDKGLHICAEHADNDGSMDYDIVEWEDVNVLEDGPEYCYERITIQ